MKKHAETGSTGGISNRSLRSALAMQSLASSDLAVKPTSDGNAKNALDKFGAHSSSDMKNKEKGLKDAQKLINSYATDMGRVLENSDITKGAGREAYLVATQNMQAGTGIYRSMRNSYMDSSRSNESVLESRARILNTDVNLVESFRDKTPADNLRLSTAKTDLKNVSSALKKTISDRRKFDGKYPPI